MINLRLSKLSNSPQVCVFKDSDFTGIQAGIEHHGRRQLFFDDSQRKGNTLRMAESPTTRVHVVVVAYELVDDSNTCDFVRLRARSCAQYNDSIYGCNFELLSFSFHH